MRILSAGILLIATVSGLLGQSFDVASIRPDDRGLFVRPPNCGQFTAWGAVAKLLVMFAYDVQDSQIVGGPPWFATDKWAIQAKSDKDQYSVEETRTMLQHLLADRFSLRVHRSTQEVPVYVLSVAKGGPKFKASEGERTNVQIGPNSISLQAATIDRLTTVLATSLGRPVIDRTGLTANYDLSVQWDDAPVRDGGLPGVGATAPIPSGNERGSIFTALPDQIGLRLDSQRAPVQVLVVDGIERPTAN
jgi:uncharacterized protein (TIGR03435 family)